MKKYLLAVCALCALTMPALAGPCDTILVGIYDKKYFESEGSRLETILNVLKRYQVSSLDEARRTALDSGMTLPIEGIPIDFKFGYKTDNSNKGTWAHQLEAYFHSHVDERTKYIASTETANKDIIAAWQTCVVSQKGLVIWPELSGADDEEIILTISYRPIPHVPTVKITHFDFDKAKLSLLSPAKVVGIQVPLDPHNLPIRMRKNPTHSGPITLSVRTSDSDITAHLELKGVPKRADPPPPSIAQSAIDFDGDRSPDKLAFGTHSIITYLTRGDQQIGVEQEISDTFNPHLDKSQWVSGDFDGDGKTDLVYVVLGGVVDPGYVHVFWSHGNGTFHGQRFDFKDKYPQYDPHGKWDGKDCGTQSRRSRLVHSHQNGDVHHWLATPTGLKLGVGCDWEG